MKLIPSIAFNDFSGSSGNVTARKIGDKTVLSSRTKHSRKKTPSQAAIRCRFGDTSRSYSEITEEQRQGWISLANNLGSYTTSTGSTSITGHNLFVAINTYRKICGKPFTADAPAQLLPSRYINVGDFWLSPEHIVFANVALQMGSNDVVLFEMYAAQSPAETRAWDKTSIVAVVHETDWGEVDLTKAYLEKFGTPLQIGQRVFIKVCRIDSDCGYVKWFSMLGSLASEKSFLYERIYKPRAKIGMDQIVPVSHEVECKDIDYEISTSSKITSNFISLSIINAPSIGCEFPHNGLSDAFNYDRSYQYSRGTPERKYLIQCMDVKIFNNSKKAINLYCIGGMFTKQFETFGTYFLTN